MSEIDDKLTHIENMLAGSLNSEVTNTKKNQEKQKRDRNLIFKKAKWLLYDELLKESKNVKDLNELLYNIDLRDKIIEKAICNLQTVLNYKYISDELQEDINFFLLENYNSLAGKIISIQTKEKKELERQEKEKQKAEFQKQLLLQYEEMQKENAKQERIQAEKEKEEKIINLVDLLFGHPFIILFVIIIGILISMFVGALGFSFFPALGLSIIIVIVMAAFFLGHI